MFVRLNITKNTDELKKLIAEHQDYQIAVLAGEGANCGDYGWMYCSSISFEVGEMLDTDYFDYYDETITDRDRLEELVEDSLYDEGLKGEELDKAIKAKMEELEQYWIKCIFIWASN